MEKIKINLECCFAELKNNRLIYRCRECKEEWKTPIEGLIKKFLSVYQFCNGNLDEFVVVKKSGLSL